MRLYLHIPFCLRKCPYCDFVSFKADRGIMRDYLQALAREMRIVRELEGGGALESVYFGGGTPSLYRPRELGWLLEEAAALWGLREDAEVSVEVNPATWKGSEIREAWDLGFNRMSLGVQSFRQRDLEVLGRPHGSIEALEAACAALALRGPTVGFDLIYGIPGQSITDWEETLSLALRMKPHHLSFYLLTLDEGMPLKKSLDKGHHALPDDEEAAAMYEAACGLAAEHGYVHYEVSNFALPGHFCSHNLACWRREGYLGLGLAAHSFLPPSRRWSNIDDLNAYMASLGEGKLPLRREERLTPEEEREEEAMLALRTAEGLRRSFLLEGKGGDRQHNWLKWLEEEGMVWMKEDAFGLTEKGMFVSNDILATLLCC